MKKLFFLFVFSLLCNHLIAQPQFRNSDSLKVIRLLKSVEQFEKGENLMIRFARELKGKPYVGKTLDQNSSERLVINLRQLDCTTYVENVLALSICAKKHLKTFRDFCKVLQEIRYKRGQISFLNRLHYFSAWIENNSIMGHVREINAPNPPFTGTQQLEINYMSSHPQFYPMLIKHPEWVKEIAALERQMNGLTFSYIPKNAIANTPLYRKTIHNGDIIAIITNIKGLDTSHIGIAIWHKDGLHLLNASSVHKCVVEEPMLLNTYMSRHPSQVGIRVVRVL